MNRQQAEQRRRDAINQAKGIHALARSENRGFTEAEQAQHDALVAEVEAIDRMFASNAAMERLAAVTVPETQTVATMVANGTAVTTRPRASVVVPSGGAPGADRYNGFTFAQLLSGGYQASAVSGSSVGAGGVLVPQEVSEAIWPTLEQESVVIAAGVRVLPVERDGLIIPRIAERPQGSWITSDDEIPAAGGSFAGIKIALRKVAIRQEVSNDLLRDANQDVSAMLMDQQRRSLATTIDDALFEGSGVENEPRGLKYRDDIVNVSMGANGAVPTDLDPFVDALSQLMSRNARPSAWVMHPQIWGVLSKLKEETTSSNVPLLGVGTDVPATGLQRRLLGLPVVLHSGLTITEAEGSSGPVCGSVYVAQWDQVLLARGLDMLTQLDQSRLFHRDMSELRTLARLDVATPNVGAVCRIRGVRGHLEA